MTKRAAEERNDAKTVQTEASMTRQRATRRPQPASEGAKRFNRAIGVLLAGLVMMAAAGLDDARGAEPEDAAAAGDAEGQRPSCGGPVPEGRPLPKRCIRPDPPSTSLLAPLASYKCAFVLVVGEDGVPLEVKPTHCIPAVLAEMERVGLMWRFHTPLPDTGERGRQYPMAYEFVLPTSVRRSIPQEEWEAWVNLHQEESTWTSDSGCRLELALAADGRPVQIRSSDLAHCAVVPHGAALPEQAIGALTAEGCQAQVTVTAGRARRIESTTCDPDAVDAAGEALRAWLWGSNGKDPRSYQVQFRVSARPGPGSG